MVGKVHQKTNITPVFAVPDIQLNLLCKTELQIVVANTQCLKWEKRQKKSDKPHCNTHNRRLSFAMELTSGNLSSTPYLGLMTLSLQTACKGIQIQSAPENDAI
jgi:hypothetical protein